MHSKIIYVTFVHLIAQMKKNMTETYLVKTGAAHFPTEAAHFLTGAANFPMGAAKIPDGSSSLPDMLPLTGARTRPASYTVSRQSIYIFIFVHITLIMPYN